MYCTVANFGSHQRSDCLPEHVRHVHSFSPCLLTHRQWAHRRLLATTDAGAAEETGEDGEVEWGEGCWDSPSGRKSEGDGEKSWEHVIQSKTYNAEGCRYVYEFTFINVYEFTFIQVYEFSFMTVDCCQYCENTFEFDKLSHSKSYQRFIIIVNSPFSFIVGICLFSILCSHMILFSTMHTAGCLCN